MTRVEELQMISFDIILHSGSSRTLVHEAFEAMREGRYTFAEQKLEEANQEILLAHHAQTALLQDYASGHNVPVDVIMLHAQDHLMTTMTLREVALEMLELYKYVKP
ncbi:PTS cellobiose transporter subunit IIA [Streptococcus sp. zg-JUN1979]|uniref:PTS cellobiose transporter subunit IIA n=1 Tax=Streptococcus sp. zg-JUN1979 TaxID=3391450 RepID=UPI0039A7071D